MSRQHRLFRLGGCVLLASACSLVNQFDALPSEPEGDAGNGGKNATAGSDSGAAGNDGGVAGEGGAPFVAGDNSGGKAGTTSGGTPPLGDAGNGGTGGTGIDAGLLLIGANLSDDPDQYVLVTMSPELGVELDREDSTRVLGIAYDSALKDDVWYVFFTNDSGKPNDPATLEARRYNEEDGSFELLGDLEVPAPQNADQIVVFNQRLFYRSVTQQPALPPETGFTLIDTSDLEKLKLLGQAQAPDLDDLIGIIGRPNSAGKGGSVTLITGDPDDCTGAVGAQLCPIKARRGNLTTETAVAFDAAVGAGTRIGDVKSPINQFLPGFTSGSVGSSPRDIFVFPAAATADATVSIVVPTNYTDHKDFSFTFVAERFTSTAFDPCRQIVLTARQLNGQALAITTTDNGVGTAALMLGHNGYRIVYEQYTRTVLTTSEEPANPKLDAWTLLGDETSPKFDLREDDEDNAWAPEPDIVPSIVVAKTPPRLLCN